MSFSFFSPTATCKTKIVCTIGPSSSSPEKLRELIEAGMSILRLNMSHCSSELCEQVVHDLRLVQDDMGTINPVAVLLDLNGRKLRTGRVPGGHLSIEAGQDFTFLLGGGHACGAAGGDGGCVLPPRCDTGSPGYGPCLDTPAPANSVRATIPTGVLKPGDKIFVDDGVLAFTVCEVMADGADERAICLVDNSGVLGSNKGINLPTYSPPPPNGLCPQDVADLGLGMRLDVDFVTLSCIRSEAEIMALRKLLGNSRIKILTKVENRAGLERFETILRFSDGIIIDRGYLGVEIDITTIANVQRDLVRLCQLAGKPVLLANQILESLTGLPRPSRSEASDVNCAVVDGVDGVVLSSETAVGLYPVEAVQWLRRILRTAEGHIDYAEVQAGIVRAVPRPLPVSESIACSAVRCAREVGAACLVVYTEAGGTARLLAKYRPSIPVVATTNLYRTARQLAASFGLISVFHADSSAADEEHALATAIDFIKQMGLGRPGDKVVITSGQIQGFKEGTTTIMRVMQIE